MNPDQNPQPSPVGPEHNSMSDPVSSSADAATPPNQNSPVLLPAETDPGRTMGVIGFVLAFLIAIAGLVVSVIALAKSKSAGHKNNLALAGIIIAVANMVFGAVFFFVTFAGSL